MPIDRVFTVRGTGTVATGTVWSGTLRRDGRVRIEPAGDTARVRALQRHGMECGELGAGDRGAVALVGVERGALSRGDTLLQGDAWMPTSSLTVMLRVLDDAGAPLAHRQRLRVSLGTGEVLARVALFAGELPPGEEALAQLRLEHPLVARAGDRFVVRSYSPVRTIGGGLVLEPLAPKRKRLAPETAAALADLAGVAAPAPGYGSLPLPQAAAAVQAVLTLGGAAGVPANRLAVLTGMPPTVLETVLAAPDSPAVRSGETFVRPADLEACSAGILAAVTAHHALRPLDDGPDRDAVRRSASASAVVFDAAMSALLAGGLLRTRGNALALPGHTPRPTAPQEARLRDILAVYTDAGLEAPTLDELPAGVQGPDTTAPAAKY
jgi:selenocysteine-specific elongation factor